MGKTLTIQPVTRIEGHAKIKIQLDDAGNVSDTQFSVLELRGFEKFCIGKPVEEMPRITTRICGVCPWSHHNASAKTTDAVFGVDPPPAGLMLEKLAGKAIHPAAAVPGGFSRPLLEEERKELRQMADELLELAKFSMSFAKGSIFPKYLDIVKSLGVLKTGFLGTVKEDGSMDLYDGKLRMMSADGSYEDFKYEDYTDYIREHVEPWTYLKFPYMKKAGEFSMDLDNPNGIYRTNTLARMNVCDKIDTPLAQAELEEFREKFGRPAQPTLLYHWARLIELLYNAENTIRLLDDPEITSTDIRKKVEPRAARGISSVEAPRGTLIHDYETDENGLVTNVNLIVGTTHNNAAMNMSVKSAAKDLIKDGKYDQGILNTVEMMIRAHDPCLSCATHKLDGKIGVKIDIVDPEGNTLAKFSN